MAKTSGTADLRTERLKHARGFVNERRKELGLRATGRLSKGYPGPGNPITMSLDAVGVLQSGFIGGSVLLRGRDKDGVLRVRIWQDDETAKFMEDFDAGLYPELLITPKPIKVAGKVVEFA